MFKFIKLVEIPTTYYLLENYLAVLVYYPTLLVLKLIYLSIVFCFAPVETYIIQTLLQWYILWFSTF